MKNLTVTLLLTLCLSGSALPVSQSDDAIVRRVQFARGRTTMVLKGSVVNDRMTQYVLTAKAGQKMIVHVASSRKKVRFDVYARDDRAVFTDTGGEDVTDWEGELPADGDYIVSVYSTRGNARYTLEVTIR